MKGTNSAALSDLVATSVTVMSWCHILVPYYKYLFFLYFLLANQANNSKYVEKRQIILICFTSKQHFIYTEWAIAWNEKLITEMRPRFDHRITKNRALTKSTTDIFNYCLSHIASASHKKIIIYANFNFVSLLDVIYFLTKLWSSDQLITCYIA